MNNITQNSQTNIRLELLEQNNDTIAEYYSLLRKCNEIVKCNEEQFRNIFFNGLNPTSQSDSLICGLNLPLDKLVEKMTNMEKMTEAERIKEMHKFNSEREKEMRKLSNSKEEYKNKIKGYLYSER